MYLNSSYSYCNQRILQFDAQGTLLHTWDQAVASVSLFIPHKAVLDRHQTTLYVADRENRRVIAYDTTTGTGQLFSGPLEMSVYAIYMNMSSDWSMYGVFGGETGTQGFTLDHHGSLINTWGPAEVSYSSGFMCFLLAMIVLYLSISCRV